MKNRRKFLVGGSLVALGAYSYHRGLRYPRLNFEPRAMPTALSYSDSEIRLTDLILVNEAVTEKADTNTDVLRFRAFAPEPKLNILCRSEMIEFSVNNIAHDSVLSVIAKDKIELSEEQDGLSRNIRIESKIDQEVGLEWTLANNESIDFAVIGDTGGNTELDWCLTKAKQYGAKFLLHLGDFNYGNGDYSRALKVFNSAPIPCYVSIGNHDFNDKGLVYHKFRNQLGPFNHSFTVAGTRFINFDTGADFFPASGGLRGELIEQICADPRPRQVFFTHRPLRDPRPGEDHIVGSINGIEVLSNMIKQSGGGPLLTGHVHHSAELHTNGIHQYTIGEGLGHEDILLQRQVAQLLMGRATRNQAPTFNWRPLDMPWAAHQSHTHLKKLKKRGDQRLIDWYQNRVFAS